ncbi:aspartate/glutamate racemase family protein [Pseudooceanicola sp. CBS1P-1]|uniref:Aspartate/glutamate racemase family protein n=1 Tax=Pseudooceanicola albus TaxID=2692189 RepID=A0A6L7G2V8_9RHOB|nr:MULTISPECIES: aspartate/glutamate racemase family protein [Pseudooceanicola]MBT9385427.1 aspartate/glutamate racemase family protein [Pseudooceanicola endophyticus]MXN18714.1 aspartate/glutamate racemase family protein [Pseudooceanicola albus]
MAIYHARRGAQSYGHDIGILLMECWNPFPPGDVGNAATYGYPVLYETVAGVTIEALVERGEASAVDAMVEAARKLETEGCKAITSDCGYMLMYQDVVAAAVKVPVMMSSLLQLRFIASLLPPGGEIGVVCAHKARLEAGLLDMAWPERNRTVHVAGMEDQPAFRRAILDEEGVLDTDLVEAETVAVTRAMVEANPDIRAILIECSNLPPYSAAVQAATGLPVFDFITMIDMVRASTARPRFSGGY